MGATGSHSESLRSFNSRPPATFFAVTRHTERADDVGALTNGSHWGLTLDSKQWPYDPPLSDLGVQTAQEIGARLMQFSEDSGSQLHVVVTSPFFRCIQTAVQICCQLGRNKVKLLIDSSLGEIFGPCVMGEVEPETLLRPLQQTVDYCKEKGFSFLDVSRLLGKRPEWPETLRSARQRMANRFVEYLRRGQIARRNFLLVSHADCVGSSLSLIPSTHGRHIVEQVGYGGHFFVQRFERQRAVTPSVNDAKSEFDCGCVSEASFPSSASASEFKQSNRGSFSSVCTDDGSIASESAELSSDFVFCCKSFEAPIKCAPPTSGQEFKGELAKRRAAALMRRQEALDAMRASRDATDLRGIGKALLADAQDSLSPSIESSEDPTGLHGTSLGGGWYLQTSNIKFHIAKDERISSDRQTSPKKVFHSGLTLLLPSSTSSKLSSPEFLNTLPDHPLAKESTSFRRASIDSAGSSALFGGLGSRCASPQSPLETKSSRSKTSSAAASSFSPLSTLHILDPEQDKELASSLSARQLFLQTKQFPRQNLEAENDQGIDLDDNDECNVVRRPISLDLELEDSSGAVCTTPTNIKRPTGGPVLLGRGSPMSMKGGEDSPCIKRSLMLPQLDPGTEASSVSPKKKDPSPVTDPTKSTLYRRRRQGVQSTDLSFCMAPAAETSPEKLPPLPMGQTSSLP